MFENASNTTSCWPNHAQITTLGWLAVSCGITSFLGCLLIYFLVLLFSKYRNTIQRLVIYLTITVNIYSVVFILHGVRNILDPDLKHIENDDPFGYSCKVMGFIDQTVSFMELIALTCVIFDILIKVVFLYFETTKFEVIYILLIILLPFVTNWIPFIDDNYGYAGSYCWITQYKNNSNCTDKSTSGLLLRFLLYWVPFYLILFLIFFGYTFALITAKRRITKYTGIVNHREQMLKELLHTEINRYKYLPFFMALLFILPTISRIIEAIIVTESFIYLRIIHLVIFGLQGFIMAMFFVLDRETRKQLRKFRSVRAALFTLFCPCKRKRVQEYNVVVDANPSDSLLPFNDTQNKPYGTNEQARDSQELAIHCKSTPDNGDTLVL